MMTQHTTHSKVPSQYAAPDIITCPMCAVRRASAKAKNSLIAGLLDRMRTAFIEGACSGMPEWQAEQLWEQSVHKQVVDGAKTGLADTAAATELGNIIHYLDKNGAMHRGLICGFTCSATEHSLDLPQVSFEVLYLGPVSSLTAEGQ